jgi:hypothetical protein
MFMLVTDCVVCIGFSWLWFAFCLVFPANVLPVHVLKRKGHPKPATTAQFFSDRPPAVL